MCCPHFSKSIAAAGLLVFATTSGALAQVRPAMTSVYSEVSRTRCPNDFNRPLSQLGEHQTITYSCPGRAGYSVDIAYHGASVQVTFRRSGDRKAQAQLGAGHDVGDIIEWRGEKAVGGFSPAAAILRLRAREGAKKFGDVLGIVRIESGNVCPAAFIDVGATPNANERARQTADEIGADFHCGEGATRIVGSVTERASEALARAK